MSRATAPPHSRPSSRTETRDRYEDVWTTIALLAASVWVAVAFLETPRLPLLGLAAALGAVGGILFVRAPASTRRGRQQYVAGALSIAGLVLVTVGIGHHLVLGLATVAVLAGSSPSVVRWLGRR